MPKLSVTIVTLNEATHIAAAIDSVSWADEIIVVDAGSSDDTAEIARRKGARVSTRQWSGWVDQKNHAASLAANDWIFSLDADERVTQRNWRRRFSAHRAVNRPFAAIECRESRSISDAG